MKRREAMRMGAMIATAFAVSGPVLAFQENKLNKRLKPVSFKNGVHSVALPDGTWNLWVRPDPRSINVLMVRLRLQIAEDKEFTSLVSEDVLTAHRAMGYIINKNYKITTTNTPLYFRYLVMPKNKFEYTQEVQVSPVGLLKPFS